MRRRTGVAASIAGVWVLAVAAIAAPAEAQPASTPGAADLAFTPIVLAPDGSAAPAAAGPASDEGSAVLAAPAGAGLPDGLRLAGEPPDVADPGTAPAPTRRPAARQPEARGGVYVKPTPKPVVRAVTVRTTGHSLRGRASWYCKAGVSVCMAKHPDGPGAQMYAAAGPALRRAICGSAASNCWRNRRVLVNGVAVILADWCQCNTNKAYEKAIDLYWDAWVRVPGVTKGVTIRW